jgi:hypothetical protein
MTFTVQHASSTDRLVCAVLIGGAQVNKAVGLLVEAGFATESILVLLSRHEEEDDDEEDRVVVGLRTGVRRTLPIASALGALGGIGLALHDGNPASPLVAQLVTGLATGGFLGAMAGIVMGLGHWQHFVDFPDIEIKTQPMLVAVDLAAQGREAEARGALNEAGAKSVEICGSREARKLLASAAREGSAGE